MFYFLVQMGLTQQSGLPPSLQYLAGLDQIIVKQKIEALEGKSFT